MENIKDTKKDKAFTATNYVLLTIFAFAVAYPLYYIIIASFSSGEAIVTGRVILYPIGFNLEGYKAIFRYDSIMTGYVNSLFYMIAGTAINVVMTMICAYPLARKDLPGKVPIMMLLTFTMYFSGGLVPTYLLINNLGLTNTRWVMLIPNALAVWNVIITRTFIQTSIPDELREATEIDGANDFQYFFLMVLPLSTAIIAVITLFYAVGHWNAYFEAMIYLSNDNLFPLQLILRRILVLNEFSLEMLADDAEVMAFQQQLADLLKFSLIIVASLPVMMIYPFVQKYFVKGVMIGSIKG